MTKYDWKNKEKFLIDLLNSKNRCDFLIKNNLTATSGNYNTIRKWLSYHDIKISSNKKEININNIFIENSFYNRGSVKKIIMKNNLIPYKCECCGNKGIWNNKSLTLQLEHKNGINNDHRIENLTFLCPNCHTQTPSYAGANNSKNKFAERLPLLLNYKIIKREHLIEFSKVWNLSIDTIKHWIIKNENKLNIYNIQIAELNKVYNQKKDSISKSTKKMNRLNDLKSIDEIGSMLENLSKKWNISKNNIKPWLKRNATDYYNQIEEYLRNKKVEVKIKIIPQEKIDLTYRFNEVYQLTNKKQVPQLARKWRVSDTGAKKWIRNNMPEKFKEIYDDSLLEKNKKLALKNDKANYIKSLNLDTFDLENIMIELKTNKSGLYSLIKNKNPTLYEQLTNHIHCKFCNGKVRTSGFNKDEQPRYRCVSEECGKSFMIA